jgi:hypothetical protein
MMAMKKSASVAEGGFEKLKGSGEGEALGATGGEEAASDAWGGGRKP